MRLEATVAELRAEVAELRAMITAVRAPADGDGLKHSGVGLANGGSPTPWACDCSGRVFLPPDDAFEPGVGLGRDPAARPSDEVRVRAIPTDSKIYVVCRGAAGAVRDVAGLYVSYGDYAAAVRVPNSGWINRRGNRSSGIHFDEASRSQPFPWSQINVAKTYWSSFHGDAPLPLRP